MDFYKGKFNDSMTGGGKHIETQGWGNEMYNFLPIKGKYYGYVRVSKDRSINLNRLGAIGNVEKLDNVLIVWTAKHPDIGGTYIIGWYKNATVYRYYQEPAKSLNRKWQNFSIGYCTTAKLSDAKLLAKDERILKIPRGPEGMGQTNIWYGDSNEAFVEKAKKYIYEGKMPITKNKNTRKTVAWQPDPLIRLKVEEKAVKHVIKYYEKIGFDVDSVEKDNIGWDLTAVKEKIKLKLEVKGLSGKEIVTEMTPNELKNLEADKNNYRLCIVTEALTKPMLRVFAYSEENGKWTSEDDITIKFEKIISARIYGE